MWGDQCPSTRDPRELPCPSHHVVTRQGGGSSGPGRGPIGPQIGHGLRPGLRHECLPLFSPRLGPRYSVPRGPSRALRFQVGMNTGGQTRSGRGVWGPHSATSARTATRPRPGPEGPGGDLLSREAPAGTPLSGLPVHRRRPRPGPSSGSPGRGLAVTGACGECSVLAPDPLSQKLGFSRNLRPRKPQGLVLASHGPRPLALVTSPFPCIRRFLQGPAAARGSQRPAATSVPPSFCSGPGEWPSATFAATWPPQPAGVSLSLLLPCSRLGGIPCPGLAAPDQGGGRAGGQGCEPGPRPATGQPSSLRSGCGLNAALVPGPVAASAGC